MGEHRNGARTFLDIILKACKLSRLPGFRLGLNKILGPGQAEQLFLLWDPLCLAVDLIAQTDNFYNKKDTSEDFAEDEDYTPGV